MRVFVNLRKGTQFMDGEVNFGFNGLGKPILYNKLQIALEALKDDQFTMELEFVNDEEIVEAIHSSISGDNTLERFHIKWHNSFERKKVS